MGEAVAGCGSNHPHPATNSVTVSVGSAARRRSPFTGSWSLSGLGARRSWPRPAQASSAGWPGSEGIADQQGQTYPGWARRVRSVHKRWWSLWWAGSIHAVKAVMIKVKTIFRRNISQPLQTLIRQLNPALRGWCAYFRPGVSAATFADLARYTRDRFIRWARRKHRRITCKTIHRRYRHGRWWPVTPEITLFNPDNMHTTRYRYRGTAIPAPWPATG